LVGTSLLRGLLTTLPTMAPTFGALLGGAGGGVVGVTTLAGGGTSISTGLPA